MNPQMTTAELDRCIAIQRGAKRDLCDLFRRRLAEAGMRQVGGLAVDDEFLRMQTEVAEACNVPVYWGSFQGAGNG